MCIIRYVTLELKIKHETARDLLDKERKENQRLLNVVGHQKETEKLMARVDGLNKECQELTRDLVGAKEREAAFRARCDEIREEYGDNEEALNQLRVDFSALQAKHGELTHNHK